MRYKVTPNFPDKDIVQIASIELVKGNLVIYPTDTVYAIGANGLDPIAIQKVFQIKRRPIDKPIHVIVSDLEMASSLVELNDAAIKLARDFLPGPLTIVLPKRNIVPDILVANGNTLGIRMPDNSICSLLASYSRVPITTTSANVSGSTNLYDIEQVLSDLEENLHLASCILDQGRLDQTPPSTIVDLSTLTPTILREGPISSKDIFESLGY